MRARAGEDIAKREAEAASKRAASRMSVEEPKRPRRDGGGDDGEGSSRLPADDGLGGLTRRISGLSTTANDRVSQGVVYMEGFVRAHRIAPAADQAELQNILDLLRRYPESGLRC